MFSGQVNHRKFISLINSLTNSQSSHNYDTALVTLNFRSGLSAKEHLVVKPVLNCTKLY